MANTIVKTDPNLKLPISNVSTMVLANVSLIILVAI
jgi:hypothetical protein